MSGNDFDSKMRPRDEAFEELLQRVEVLEDAVAQQAFHLEDLEKRLAQLGNTVAQGPAVYR